MLDVSKRSDKDAPLVIKFLSDYVKKWQKTGNTILMTLRNTKLESMRVRFPSIFMSFETKTEFSTRLDVVPHDRMDSKNIRLYRRLKGMECQLAYKGIFQKKPFFEIHDSLKKLRSYLPDLAISPALRDFLSKDKELMSLIKELKPDNVEILLSSLNPMEILSSKQEDNLIPIIVDFYLNPPFISWEVFVTKMISKGFRMQKKYINMMKLVERIVILLNTFTSNQETIVL